MDEFICSDVVRGRGSGVDDFRAKSAGASTFKWFLGHLVGGTFYPLLLVYILVER